MIYLLPEFCLLAEHEPCHEDQDEAPPYKRCKKCLSFSSKEEMPGGDHNHKTALQFAKDRFGHCTISRDMLIYLEAYDKRTKWWIYVDYKGDFTVHDGNVETDLRDYSVHSKTEKFITSPGGCALTLLILSFIALLLLFMFI